MSCLFLHGPTGLSAMKVYISPELKVFFCVSNTYLSRSLNTLNCDETGTLDKPSSFTASDESALQPEPLKYCQLSYGFPSTVRATSTSVMGSISFRIST